MEVGAKMITEFPSIIFRLRSGSTAPDMLILRKHHNKNFVAIVESDYPPDAVTSRVAGAILSFVVKKYDQKQFSN